MNTSNANCKICGSTSAFIFTKRILLKYDVSYFQCSNCGFMQTEIPYWLEETYQASFYAIDTGLIARPLRFGQVTDRLIMQYFNPNAKFVDFGGANGVFVRLMRDKGFDFYRYDRYAKNIYALGFDIKDLPEEEHRFELVTSFEVLEHFENPLENLRDLFLLSNNILFSTFLQPHSDKSELQTWWYLAELHGQHISFYTVKALKFIAEKFSCYYYSNDIDLHLFTPKKIRNFGFYSSYSNSIPYKIKYLSLKAVDRFYNRLLRNTVVSHPQTLTFKDSDWVKEQFIKGGMLK
jgi:2-polyprenyl-3-methyl-5-hydroxy-6-metoxy-1,4-benzoquinol methylase